MLPKTLIFVLLLAFVQFNGVDSSKHLQKRDTQCTICTTLLTIVDELIESNASEEYIESVIITICTNLHIAEVDETVCKGIIPSFGPTVLPILVEVALDPSSTCKRLGYCDSDDYLTPKRPILNLPPRVDSIPSSKGVGGTVRVVHVSDLHMDEMYIVGADAECGEPLCCRNITKDAKRTAQKWGDYRCDINEAMMTNFLVQLSKVNPPPDFIVWTGDNTPHDVWMENPTMQIDRLKRVSDMVAQYLPKVAVYPALGNHDTFPVDQFNRKPKDLAHHDNFEWLLDGITSYWSRWLPSSALSTLKSGGYYEVQALPGLRVIALTTQWGDPLNFYLLLEENQQAEEINWLIATLTDAEKKGDKVMIIGHIPNGLTAPSWYNPWAEQYNAIIDRFSHIIVGQFYGHTHRDHFEMFKSNGTNTPNNVLYIAPSVTTFTNQNPSYRIYEYDGTTYTMLDYSQYICNMTAANLNDNPTWELEYSAKSEYALSDLSPQSWYNLTLRFEQDDALFQRWYSNYHTRVLNEKCTGSCKIEEICSLQNATPESIDACVTQAKLKQALAKYAK